MWVTMRSIIGYALLACLVTTVKPQASQEQCAAQICCAHGNQDLSASCWDQCFSYQQQLAEIGCHILPPKPTSSSAPQIAPTLTTSWGPGQFCQGYSPGGGDSCMTIPAGCYVVPSGYNVEPQLHCTATATPSSTAVSSTALAVQITPSSTASSSVVPSSSVISASSTSIAFIISSSSATTVVSNSASSAAPRITTSAASMPPTLTAPSSMTPSSSVASSSAVQSSSLPGIVGSVSSSATSASNAADAFSQNPTTDTETALKQAVSAARNAATAAKSLADAAAFTALSAELATVLSSLSEAAATLASAEALADIAAAVAPEIAAAAAAAATAQAIEAAGPNSPNATAQQPSANQPSVTQPSLTNSANPSTGSMASTSAATVSSVMSASGSSTMTSSATASASTCDACVACADSTIAPIPTPGPDDPFAQYAGSIPDNSTASKPRKRFHSANFVELDARANSATRDVKICGQYFSAPSYNSYSGAGNGNFYSPYYSYRFQLPRCSSYDWALTQGPTPPDGASYATEHIYELQLIAIFLRWLATNDAGLQAYLAANNRNICANFINQILFGQGQQWTLTPFGQGGRISTPGSRPIDELLSQLSGGARPAELVYLETHLNGLTAQLFASHTPSTLTLPAAQLALLAHSSALYLYLRDPHVSTIFRAVSARLHAFYAKLDTACAGTTRGPCAAGVRWADGYQRWQLLYLRQIDAGWQAWKSVQVVAARAKIAPKAPGSAMWQALLEAVDRQTTTGLLSGGSYSFAAGLMI